jgi:prepilin-type N-terminal cleavage/methylation domain-containing protein
VSGSSVDRVDIETAIRDILKHMKRDAHSQKGFTLIEILVVIGIIAILAAVVIVALNPARQFAQARNSQRWSNVNTVLNAIGQRLADNRGNWSGTGGCETPLPSTSTHIGSASAAFFNLAPCVIPTYVSTMVSDPSVGTVASTGYFLMRDSSTGRITVSAPYAELGETISVTR